jgi:hypothetical protein
MSSTMREFFTKMPHTHPPSSSYDHVVCLLFSETECTMPEATAKIRFSPDGDNSKSDVMAVKPFNSHKRSPVVALTTKIPPDVLAYASESPSGNSTAVDMI